MPRDGSGTFTRAVTPPNNGDVADADDYNTEHDDIATALTDSINVNGTKAFAADQSAGGFKLTNLGTPTNSGDAVSKTYLEGRIGVSIQGYDATLTALAALSWSSGSPVLQFTAADTVSLTLTPSLTSVTASGSGAAGNFTNTADSSTVIALNVSGDRATPAANDAVAASFFLSDSVGTQTEFCRLSAQATTVTDGAEAGRFLFGVLSGGSISNEILLNSTNFAPVTNDGNALGSASASWADLFLASGAVINFNNGGVTLTHDATNDRLVLAAGALKARPAISTDTGGTLTSASDNCIVDLATAPTINDGVHEAGSIIVLVNNTASSMTITQDTGMTLRLHGTATTGNQTLAARGIATVQIDPVSNAEAIVLGDVS